MSKQVRQTSPDVGTESGIHDIRALAAQYRADNERENVPPDIEFVGIDVSPGVLLAPVAPKRGAEAWKMLAFALLLLLGIGSTAMALGLRQPDPRGPRVQFVSPLPPQKLPQLLETEPALYSPVAPLEPAIVELSGRILPPPPKTSEATPAKTSETSKPRLSSTIVSCDEVACLTGNAGCCERLGIETAAKRETQPSESRSYRLTRSQAREPLQSIETRIHRCFDTYDFRGVATVQLRIGPEGDVQNFKLAAGSMGFQNCVREQVTALQFHKLQQPFTLNYPYIYR